MKCESPQCAEMLYWDYGRPPSVHDLVQNNFISRAVRILIHIPLRVHLRLFHRFRSRRNVQLKHLRGHLIVANHSSHLDAPVLFAAFPISRINGLRTLCAKDYFFEHPLKWMIAFFLGNTIPMARDRYDARAVSYCRKKIEQGANIILFPEGTRSPDGRMGQFKAGVGLLALKYGLPVIPAFIRGTYECCRKGRVFPRPGRIEVIFGRPVRYRGPANRRRNWIAVAEDLQRRVSRLAAQPRQEQEHNEYVTDQDVESIRPHAGQAERRRSHRSRARVHLGQNGGLRLPERTVGETADRQVP